MACVDTEAGPDINEEEFRSANDIFKGENLKKKYVKNCKLIW